MSDNENTWPKVERRKGPPIDCPEVYHQLAQELDELKETVVKLERCIASLKTAFVLNDLGKPDFDGHRKAHNEMVKAAQTMDTYKQEGAKVILRWFAGVVLSALVLGFGLWIKELPK